MVYLTFLSYLFLVFISEVIPSTVPSGASNHCYKPLIAKKTIKYQTWCRGWWYTRNKCEKTKLVHNLVGKLCKCCNGYEGQCGRCKPICKPTCQNEGVCVAPGRCKCPPGTSGTSCEEASCVTKCENSGYCGRKNGKNECMCPLMFGGDKCESFNMFRAFDAATQCFTVVEYDDVTGYIATANYGLSSRSTYWDNAFCEKTLTTLTNRFFVLEILEMEIESGNLCPHDSLLMVNRDGNALGGTKFCGTKASIGPEFHTLNAINNEVTFTFTTDGNDNKKGFKIEYRTIRTDYEKNNVECWAQNLVSSDAGFQRFRWTCACCPTYSGVCPNCVLRCFKEPSSGFKHNAILQSGNGDEGSYANNMNCQKTLTAASSSQVIEIEITRMDIYSTIECKDTYLEFWNSDNTLIGRFCGNTLPLYKLYSTTQEVTVKFVSGPNVVSNSGYEIRYQSVSPPNLCLRAIWTSQTTGNLTTKQPYDNNKACAITISAPSNMIVVLTMKSFDVRSNKGCRSDSVWLMEKLKIYRQLCGTDSSLPSLGVYQSQLNALTIYLTTDTGTQGDGFTADINIISPNAQKECWWLNMTSTKNGILNTYNMKTGYNYPNNQKCNYIIESTSPITYELTYVDIESSASCNNDYVQLYESTQLIGRYCGTSKISGTTTGNILNIDFVSNGDDTYHGFSLAFSSDGLQPQTSSDAPTCFWSEQPTKSTDGFVKSGNYLTKTDKYWSKMSCYEEIKAPQGHMIQFEPKYIDIETSPECTKDRLILYENSTIFKVICGDTVPPIFTSRQSIVTVAFFSDEAREYTGFSLNYKFVKDDTVCWNKRETKLGRYLETGNYRLRNYWPNMDCMETIKAPVGYTVKIQFSSFDVEGFSPNCLFDNLTIYDDSKVIATLCDEGILPRDVVSSTHNVKLRFRTDDSRESGGFQIVYSFHKKTELPDCPENQCMFEVTNNVNDGQLTSANHACMRDYYWPNQFCTYQIDVPTGMAIEVHFSEFDLEDSAECDNDYVKIFEIINEVESPLQLLCGIEKPQNLTVKLTTKHLYITFKTDSVLETAGFKLQWRHISFPSVDVPIPEDIECGMRETEEVKVVGGRDSKQGHWPWMASLQYEGKHKCGATLITHNMVVTAAHCLYNQGTEIKDVKKLKIYLGAIKLSDQSGTGELYSVCSLIPHTLYDAELRINDIAIVKLCTSIKFSRKINRICTPTFADQFETGLECVVTGWGAKDIRLLNVHSELLMEVNVDVVDSRQCDKAYKNTKIEETMLCAGGVKGKDACTGDSGGPLQCQTSQGYKLAGIVSFGPSGQCGKANTPGVFTRVNKFELWLRAHIELYDN